MSTATVAEPTVRPDEASRALEDPAFRRRFAAAYDGPGNPEHALLWLADPERPAPSGESSGAARIRELRRAVYASQAGAALAPELRGLQELVEQRHHAAEQAFRAAALPDRRPVSSTSPPSPPGSGPGRRNLLLVGCAALAAALGAVVGVASAAPAAVEAQPRFSARVAISTRGIEELSRPWQHADGVTVTFGPVILADSVRRLAGYPDGETLVYAARDRFGDVCLLAAAIYYQSACVSPEQFRSSGVTLAWTLDSTPSWRAPETGVALWRPDGRLLLGPAVP